MASTDPLQKPFEKGPETAGIIVPKSEVKYTLPVNVLTVLYLASLANINNPMEWTLEPSLEARTSKPTSVSLAKV